jgi:hypothetical protein
VENNVLQILIPATGLVSGLIGAYVGVQNRALLAEVRKELAEMENRVITRINGTFVRASECRLREDLFHERLNAVMEAVRSSNAAEQ